VLLDRAELVAWTGRRLGLRAYVDDARLADGDIVGLTVLRTGGGAIRAEVRPGRRRWWPASPPGRRRAAHRAADGRAVQVSCDEARLTVDGRARPRPVTRHTWWVEPDGWLLVGPH
jgi:DNA-binding IclR family transcriptional regulator